MAKKNSSAAQNQQIQTQAISFSPKAQEPVFPIVAMGASAGGLAAFEAFFKGLPAEPKPNMAFVLVQHLAPDHQSLLKDLIQRYTPLPVFEIEQGMQVQSNSIYIIPPNRDLRYVAGQFVLAEPVLARGKRLPIDLFFQSLADELTQHAIGIVLSGTGHDGSAGLQAIQREGGLTLVQKPDTAEYDGMPRSALERIVPDFVLPPVEMATQLGLFFEKSEDDSVVVSSPLSADPGHVMQKIFNLLRIQLGHDFSQYKPNTIARRVERRMAVHHLQNFEQYLEFLQEHAAELDALFCELLIGVTSFFRDPEAFAALEQQVIPKIFETPTFEGVLRIWVPACSTGEEAYSLAILCAEHQAFLKENFNIQIFATDIDSRAIAKARSGHYSAESVANLSPERLARYFSRVSQETEGEKVVYRVHKAIRDMLVFSEQDVIKDPPFSKLDLISCRNLLIYLGGALQKRVIPLFHYALNARGYLFLGTSENVTDSEHLFKAVDRRHKIYQGITGSQQSSLSAVMPPLFSVAPRVSLLKHSAHPSVKLSLRSLTEQSVLQMAVPAAVLVSKNGDILYIHGRTGLFLEPAPGEIGVNNIVKMARDGLQRELSAALHRAALQHETVVCRNLQVKTNGDYSAVNLSIYPVSEPLQDLKEPLFLVVLEAVPCLDLPEQKPLPVLAGEPALLTAEADLLVASLRQELRAKEEFLQTTNEELETTNEELRASNEEMQSVNEELQSTNEELETAKEELQSINEELATINAELQAKVLDLSRANNDMNNLLAGTEIATIFVDHALNILRFTPTATRIINLIQADIGRPVGDLVSNLVDYTDFSRDIQTVLDTLIPLECEVQSQAGKWFMMRILPYRTLENVIEGAVITFVDISAAKKAQIALQKFPLHLFSSLLLTTHEALLALDTHLNILAANAPAFTLLGDRPESLLGKPLLEIKSFACDPLALRALFEVQLAHADFCEHYLLTLSGQTPEKPGLWVNARKILDHENRCLFILLAFKTSSLETGGRL